MSRHASLVRTIGRLVHNELGGGCSEQVYHNAFLVELRARCVPYESEVVVPILYKGTQVGHVRADVVLEKTTVIELKAKADLKKSDFLQLLSYLKHLKLEEGYLVNFAEDSCQISEYPERTKSVEKGE